MKTFLIWLPSLAVSIGAVLFYTFADYGIVALATAVIVGGAWIYGRESHEKMQMLR